MSVLSTGRPFSASLPAANCVTGDGTQHPVDAATDRLTGVSYDAAGNVTRKGTLSALVYDPFNRLTHLTGTSVHQAYLCDADGERLVTLDYQGGEEM